MKFKKALFFVAALPAFFTCGFKDKNEGNNAPAKGYSLVNAFPNITFDLPVELTAPNDGTQRIFVVEQKGRIMLIDKNNATKSNVFLDITDRVTSGGETGLLGLAFHPDYKNNGYFYVNYTRPDPLRTIIARYKVNASNAAVADANSETILLSYDQLYSNHNGGKLAFGNDGFLYIAVGDGGSGGDPGNRAQNRKDLHGKILRIDVNKPSGNLNYGIPSDNPFANNKEGYREEIYSYGMRNPWRFSFDKQTNMLWCGDVGQNKIEEVDIIEKGGNYGWNIMEAEECYKSNDCNKAGLIEPVISYNHGSETGNSITGGYVCRDKNLPSLNGKYVYGDFTSGNIWALTYSNKKVQSNNVVAVLKGGLSSFGEDDQHNLYALAYSTGIIYHLQHEQ